MGDAPPPWLAPSPRPLSLHERHYRLLEDLSGQLLPELHTGTVYRLRAEGSMDLGVEALSFQQAQPPIYQRVYPNPGMINPRLERELNAFLGTWLRNLKAQGHRLVPGAD